MKPKRADSHAVAFPRCHHTYANGKRCLLPPPENDSVFCVRHAKLPENQIDSEDTASLTAGLTEFTSAWSVNQFLSRLLLLLSQNRISPRRAAVLSYVASQILRTIAAMDREDERELNSQENGLEAFFPGRSPAPDETECAPEEQDEEQSPFEPQNAAAPENNSLHSAASAAYRCT
jgi:hypothetical protein